MYEYITVQSLGWGILWNDIVHSKCYGMIQFNLYTIYMLPLGSIKTHNAIIGIFNALENAKLKKYMTVGKPFLSA